MNATIFLTFVATVVASQLALISDLLMVVIVLALLIVLITTEPATGEGDEPRAQRQPVPIPSSPDKFPPTLEIYAATWLE